jgi:hypothetical protein
LSVTVEFETLTVATPVETLSAMIPVRLLEAKQFSIFISTAALVVEKAIRATLLLLPEATLFRMVTAEPSRARSPS